MFFCTKYQLDDILTHKSSVSLSCKVQLSTTEKNQSETEKKTNQPKPTALQFQNSFRENIPPNFPHISHLSNRKPRNPAKTMCTSWSESCCIHSQAKKEAKLCFLYVLCAQLQMRISLKPPPHFTFTLNFFPVVFVVVEQARTNINLQLRCWPSPAPLLPTII